MENDNIKLMTQLKKFFNSFASILNEISNRENLTQIELNILVFLKNNPALNTARDIEEYNLIKKSNISNAIEKLIEKNLLIRNHDLNDRRVIHLKITEKANPICDEVIIKRKAFFKTLFNGLSEEELQSYLAIHKKISKNLESL